MRHGWNLIIAGCALLLGILVSTPQVLRMSDARYQGISVHLNSDEYYYLPRVQEVLTGSPVGSAISGEDLPALQPGLIETAYGILFRPFGLRAAHALNLMDFAIPFTLFFVLYGFLQSCGFSKRRACVGTWLFCLLQLYGLGRPVHQGTSFLLSVLALWGLIEGMERRMLWGILGGILMGLLVGVYFWAWTFVWAWWGIMVCASLWKHWQELRKVARLLLFGAVGLVVAIPFFWSMYRLSQHPLFAEAFFRSGMGRSHMVESIPWSVLFMVMVIGVWMLWMNGQKKREWYAVLFVITAFTVLNQQVIHGIRFLFASHYLMWLVFGGVIALMYAWGKFHWKNVLVAGASVIFLTGIAYDNRHVIEQWQVTEDDFDEQHLASVLPVLDQLEQTTVLSDPETSAFIASYTDHNVLFTPYIQHELHAHREIAERYCLTQIFLPPADRAPEKERVLIYGAAYDALFDPQERARVREEELTLAEEVCVEVDSRPQEFLRKYNVSAILWNRKTQPNWQLKRLGFDIQPGEGEWQLFTTAR